MATQKRRIVRAPKQESPPTTQITKASIPEIDSDYIHRTIYGQTDFAVYDMSMEHMKNILIEGPTGTGKTSSLLAYAAERGVPFYAVPSNVGVEPSQLFGRYVPDETGKALGVWVDGGVTQIIRNGGVLLINEVNFLPPRVSTVMFSLLDKRREITLLDHNGEVIRAHRPNCWCDLDAKECRKRWVLVVADMNPNYEGSLPVNKAFRNRFATKLYFDYDDAIEHKLVRSNALLILAKQLRSEAAQGMYDTPIATNMLQEFEEFVDIASFEFARHNFVNSFQIEERPGVLLVFQTHDAALRASYAPPPPKKAAPEPEPDLEAVDNESHATPTSVFYGSDDVTWAFN